MERFGHPTISEWFAARGIDDPEIVCPVIAAFTARDAADDDDAVEGAKIAVVAEILNQLGGQATTGWRWVAAHEIVIALSARLPTPSEAKRGDEQGKGGE